MALFDDDKDQRTEEATPRRRQEAREKGQVVFSVELLAAITLVGWLMTFALSGGALMSELAATIADTLQNLGALGRSDLTPESAAGLMVGIVQSAALVVVPLIAPLYLLSLLVGFAQTGFQITPKALEIDPSKVNPMSGLKRMFGPQALVKTFSSVAKISVIATTMSLVAWKHIAEIIAVGSLELGPALAAVGHILMSCALAALAAIVALGVIDYLLARRKHENELKMTKQDIREEMRSSEGDPQVKARIRRVQREMASRRMMSEVPKSTVVVTNPTHYAVALKYDRDASPDKRGAPKVTAKGVDHVAAKIKELAREAGVVVYEDVRLARALHARCEIGDDVPVELYQAVAEVLAYVYEVQKSPALARK